MLYFYSKSCDVAQDRMEIDFLVEKPTESGNWFSIHFNWWRTLEKEKGERKREKWLRWRRTRFGGV